LEKIVEAKKKLTFAEYLINRENSENFAAGAMKHVLSAAELAIQEISQLTDNEMKNKELINRVFDKITTEPKEFHRVYFKIAESEYSSPESAANALNTVRAFVNWVEQNRQIS
tara:strand:- start:424 stop:762 length:339 start_codon:yes stop_codon:yes gene_type:complete